MPQLGFSSGRTRVVVPIVALSLIGLADIPEVRAQSNYAYCAVSRGFEITYENCGFPTFAACLEEIRGLGGFCRPNSYYVAPSAPAYAPDGPRPRARTQPRY